MALTLPLLFLEKNDAYAVLSTNGAGLKHFFDLRTFYLIIHSTGIRSDAIIKKRFQTMHPDLLYTRNTRLKLWWLNIKCNLLIPTYIKRFMRIIEKQYVVLGIDTNLPKKHSLEAFIKLDLLMKDYLLRSEP